MTIGLVDCNSFYCSCERVFKPETRGRPIIVLSNNDGCAIAFSREAKAIGFGQMCEPFFETEERIKKHKVVVFSSNYTLYDDMSKRVMTLLKNYTPELEVYSVDEAFLSLDGYDHFDLVEYGKKIRKDILKITGIPVGVGISKTKVLSKIANKLSKKSKGVWVMNTDKEIDEALKNYPVRDIWGIGSASARKLNLLGITTAYEFKMYKNENLIQKMLTKTGREVQEELRGVRCLEMEEVEAKVNIANTRSFGKDTYSKRELQEAIATFATKCAEKLRYQDSVCYGLSVFVHTNAFKEIEQYYGSGSFVFGSGTSDTIKIIKAAWHVLDQIYRPGFGYKKGGVILNHIVSKNENQLNLFNQDPSDNEKLSNVIDLINNRYGPRTIKSAACGINHAWKLRADYITKRYTTNWNEILTV
ncbi:Y-family DNA polymerase [Peredibacter starrii]|uniref:Y-family DNA polymerase n=1 Tax=Peredibacter starrii TaxID=28202 RepID=A0AAX4HUE5_9BACT|nr:Y-family DNA polymerase [Peredibacter starrii]WPU66708.1 Y-family DNA polymerase [Peredibacter starrii]